jgi:hypothetical protein
VRSLEKAGTENATMGLNDFQLGEAVLLEQWL